MRYEEIQRLGDEDLRKALGKATEDLLRIRFQLATRQLENPMELVRTRKDIARIKTLLRQRELKGS